MIAFLVNSINGITTVYDMIENQSINLQNPEEGDFEISFTDLRVKVSIGIDNTGIYDMENILIGLNFSLESDAVDFTSVLDTNSYELGSANDPEGQDIPSGGSDIITLNATLPNFDLNITEIAAEFNITDPSWNLKDLLQTGDFNAKLELYFTISFAFRQYVLKFDLSMSEDQIIAGLAP